MSCNRLKKEEITDHIIWQNSNLGHYKISIVARLKDPNFYNVAYTLRLENPGEQSIDYVLSLDGFRELGELCIALSKFCKKSIFANEHNIDKLKKLLTSENIKSFAEISELRV
jgi:hypothetical protein